MYFPLHIHGVTLFPKARYIDDCWQPQFDVVLDSGQITTIKCRGGYPAATIALAFARMEARQFIHAVRESAKTVRCE